jgi:uncharacterized protein (DUF1810 family)
MKITPCGSKIQINSDNLNRFITAQSENYNNAISELKNGQKRTHWIWFIFPQIDGLAIVQRQNTIL